MRNSEFGMRNEPDLKKRTKAFALRILKLVDALPKTTAGRALASQIVRSGTSVAANYRAACRAKSTADFIAKMGIVEEEADETLFWLELLEESELVSAAKLTAIKQEANELIAITVASIKTARRNRVRIPHSEFRIPNSNEFSALLHRPADLRGRDQYRHHARRRDRAFDASDCAISGHCATNDPGHGHLSRRQRAGGIGNGCDADRTAGQWR